MRARVWKALRITDQIGQTMAEYAIVVTVVTVGLVAVLGLLRGSIFSGVNQVIALL